VATAQYVDKHADEDTKKAVYSGKKTFNKAYKETKEKKSPTKKKESTTQNKEYNDVLKIEKSLSNVINKMKHHDCLAALVEEIKKVALQFTDVKKTLISK